MIHCLPTFLKNRTKDLQCKPTIGEKIVETLSSNKVTLENKTFHKLGCS